MIDVSKIKVGDEVTVRAKVVASGNVLNGLSSTPRRLPVVRIAFTEWVGADEIEAHHPSPREFKPGDRVVWQPNDQHIWKIIAIDGGMAWSRWDGYAGSDGPTPHSPHWGKHDQHPLQYLRHADESE